VKYTAANHQYFNSDFWRWDAVLGAMLVTQNGVVAMWTNTGDDIYLNADKSAIVPSDSPEAAYLLVASGGQIPIEAAQKYGLVGSQLPERPEDARGHGDARGHDDDADPKLAARLIKERQEEERKNKPAPDNKIRRPAPDDKGR
jgi:hypothetical protein